MIGETIVALQCVQIIVTWILAMAVVAHGVRLARLERLIARTHGYDLESDAPEAGEELEEGWAR